MDGVQVEILRRMTPEKKLKVAAQIYWAARELKAALHSDWTEQQVQKEVRDIFLHARS